MAGKRRPIKEQVVVVSGADGDAGRAIARAAARRGARVMLVGADETAIGEAMRAINNQGGRADEAIAGAGDVDAMKGAALAALGRFGRIDTWVDAGPPTGWRAVGRALRGRGGSLVVVAADTADVGSLRVELAPDIVVGSVRLAEGSDLHRLPDTVLDALARPGRDLVADGATGRRAGVRGYLPGVAIGLGGLALAAGAVAMLRRRRRA